MNYLKDFIRILSGNFDNHEQFKEMQNNGAVSFPFAKHINTVCNDKIMDLPQNFEGYFLLEESYYTTNGNTHASPHLFLFTEEDDGVKLTSYEMPTGYNKDSFTYDQLNPIDYNSLTVSQKFTPAIYKQNNGIWEGGSVSMFSPILKFTLYERFSEEQLEVSESMELNGKRTFGYDEPIIYKRVK